eukprot:127349-Pyramimonas_sp.AAC.1
MGSARVSRVSHQRKLSICLVHSWSANRHRWPAMLFLDGGRTGSMSRAVKTGVSSMTRSAGTA